SWLSCSLIKISRNLSACHHLINDLIESFDRFGGSIFISPYPAADGKEVGPGAQQGFAILNGDTADGDRGNGGDIAPPLQYFRFRLGGIRLCPGRIESAEGDIIGPGLARRHGEMA